MNTRNNRFSDDLQFTLVDERAVPIVGGLDSQVAGMLMTQLLYLEQKNRKPIMLHLNSPGGAVYQGLSIYDSIRSCKAPIDITIHGMCMSMAVVVLQAARKRRAMPNATFMLHEISGMGFGTVSQLTDTTKEAERLTQVVNDIITDRTGLTKQKLKKLTERRDSYIDAEEALSLGLIDEIVE